jgi:hypothetical protein
MTKATLNNAGPDSNRIDRKILSNSERSDLPRKLSKPSEPDRDYGDYLIELVKLAPNASSKSVQVSSLCFIIYFNFIDQKCLHAEVNDYYCRRS